MTLERLQPELPKPTGSGDGFEGDSDDVVDMAVQEMGQRLKDPLRRADIPDHVLIKFVGEANKSADRRAAERERANQERETKDEVEIILAADLPDEKKRVLLEGALARLERRAQTLRELLQQGEI